MRDSKIAPATGKPPCASRLWAISAHVPSATFFGETLMSCPESAKQKQMRALLTPSNPLFRESRRWFFAIAPPGQTHEQVHARFRSDLQWMGQDRLSPAT